LLYILWGEDEFSREEAIREIKKSLGDQSMLASNTSLLDGQKLTPNQLREVAEAVPFLSAHRLVIIKGLLERFEPAEKSARPSKAVSARTRKDDPEPLAACIKALPDSTVLVLSDRIENRKNPLENNSLFASIAGKATVKQYPELRGLKLSQWIESRVTRAGSSISRQALAVLMELIEGDLHAMQNEINKLVAFTAGRMIEEKDIRSVVSASREADIFGMVDAIIDRRAGIAEQIVQKLLQFGTVPPQMLVLLARQVQILIQVKDLKNQKRPVAEIQRAIGVFYPAAFERIAGRADKYSLERLKEIHTRILETDLAIKTGRCEGDLALNILVAELCGR